MTDLARAVREWRDARQAIFDSQFDISDASKTRWSRLAEAEHALMACARLMSSPPEETPDVSKAVPNS